MIEELIGTALCLYVSIAAAFGILLVFAWIIVKSGELYDKIKKP